MGREETYGIRGCAQSFLCPRPRRAPQNPKGADNNKEDLDTDSFVKKMLKQELEGPAIVVGDVRDALESGPPRTPSERQLRRKVLPSEKEPEYEEPDKKENQVKENQVKENQVEEEKEGKLSERKSKHEGQLSKIERGLSVIHGTGIDGDLWIERWDDGEGFGPSSGEHEIRAGRAPIYHLSFAEFVRVVAMLPSTLNIGQFHNREGQSYLDALKSVKGVSKPTHMALFTNNTELVQEIAGYSQTFIPSDAKPRVLASFLGLVQSYLASEKKIILKPGDLVRFDPCGYRNDGLYITDLKGQLRELEDDLDDYGHLPQEFTTPLLFPPNYWEDCITHNEIVWPDQAFATRGIWNNSPPIPEKMEKENLDGRPLKSLDLPGPRGIVYRLYFVGKLKNKTARRIVVKRERLFTSVDEVSLMAIPDEWG